MRKLQLESMSVDELWALHEEITQLLSARIVEEKQQLEQRLEQLSQTRTDGAVLDFRLRRTGSTGRRFYPKVYPKYQNPQVPEETWSGRGKQPKWLVKALSEGKRLEDFLISDDGTRKRLNRVEA